MQSWVRKKLVTMFTSKQFSKQKYIKENKNSPPHVISPKRQARFLLYKLWKKSREWILRHAIYVCVGGGGVSPPPLNVCLRWKQGRESDAVGCCSLWSSGNIWQCEIANRLPGTNNVCLSRFIMMNINRNKRSNNHVSI